MEAQAGLSYASYICPFNSDDLESLLMAEVFGEEIDDVSLCTDAISKVKLEETIGKKHIRLNAD